MKNEVKMMKILPHSSPEGTLTDIVIIGGFRGKSKVGAIGMCTDFLKDKAGNPKILEDKVANAPDVVPTQFSSNQIARDFVLVNKNQRPFEGFWCNLHMTVDERENYQNHVQTLFKIKRAIIEATAVEAQNIVVKKNEKKVFMVWGENLKLVATMITKNNITWEADVDAAVKRKYEVLTQ